MCILDQSQTLMSDFHYSYFIGKYGGRAKPLFTNTDSLTYAIETPDVYSDFDKDRHLFNSSDYPSDSPFCFSENKKVIGKMKDEAAGCPIQEFVGLRSKMYSYTKCDGKGGRTAKGVKKSVVKKEIRHENYRDVLLNSQQLHHNMKAIRSVNYQLHSFKINKVSLASYDDKRYLLDNGMESYAYGHYKIEQ